MAEFLNTADASAGIQRVIRDARKKLVLISAFVYPRIIHLQQLAEAGENGVHIKFVFGKRSMDKAVFKDLREIPNMDLYFLKELHAKCYLNETSAIITSLNLLNSSEANNREMGVLLEKRNDTKAFDDTVREVQSILRVAELRHSTREIATHEEQAAYRVAPQPQKPSKKGKRSLEFWLDQAQRADIRFDGERAKGWRIMNDSSLATRRGRSWYDNEYHVLERMFEQRVHMEVMCEVLQRSPASLESKLLDIGLLD